MTTPPLQVPPISFSRLCGRIRLTSSNPPQARTSAKVYLSTEAAHELNSMLSFKGDKTEGSMAKYLAIASIFTINPQAPPTVFWRLFIHKVHGGNPQAFVTRSRDGSRRFIFPMKVVNPHMPTYPGHPGLLLSGRHEMLQGTWTAFHRVQTRPSRYRYLGEYRHTLAGPLLSEEFSRQEHTASHRDRMLSLRSGVVLTSSRYQGQGLLGDANSRVQGVGRVHEDSRADMAPDKW